MAVLSPDTVSHSKSTDGTVIRSSWPVRWHKRLNSLMKMAEKCFRDDFRGCSRDNHDALPHSHFLNLIHASRIRQLPAASSPSFIFLPRICNAHSDNEVLSRLSASMLNQQSCLWATQWPGISSPRKMSYNNSSGCVLTSAVLPVVAVLSVDVRSRFGTHPSSDSTGQNCRFVFCQSKKRCRELQQNS